MNKENTGNNRTLKWFRKYHKWPALIFTFFIFLFSLSGIILNHRNQFSSVDISRKWLPSGYRYQNWNLAAVKSRIQLMDGSYLIYGNIGVWKTDGDLTGFTDFNMGFPSGIDNRKINSLLQTRNQRLFAGTLFGLFEYRSGWKKIVLPVKEERIVKVLQKGDSLLVLTRSSLLLADLNSNSLNFIIKDIPAGEDDDNRTGLFKTLWVIHSGEIYGKVGRLIVDLVGLIVVVLSLTGLFYWLAPHLLKRVRKSAGPGIKKVNRFSLKWHNRIGSWAILILLLTTLTGMFLRPPLLISIANAKVAKIRFSELDNPNPWFDRIRDILYDAGLNRYVLATSEGIYHSDDEFSSPLRRYPVQPPLSVMGITVFETLSAGEYLVGSFSGIFRWIPGQGVIVNYMTNLPEKPQVTGGRPFGSTAVAGFINRPGDSGIVFDYGKGALMAGSSTGLPEMPPAILSGSPISLWNTALEVHTGRIYEFIIGQFYILVVPLTGLAMLLILVTGFFAWWIPYRRKRKTGNPGT